MTILNRRTFTQEDQVWFSVVSGDENPIHVDESWALTHYPGAVVVHGMHSVLWAIDCAANALSFSGVESVRANFIRPMVVGDEVSVEADERGESLRLHVESEVMAVIRLVRTDAPPAALGDTDGDPATPLRERSLNDLDGASGSLAALARTTLLIERFPAACRTLGSAAAVGLTRLSTLVGMECPGRLGMFAEFSVRLQSSGPLSSMAYRVKRLNQLFGRAEMSVSGCGLHGTVVAYVGRQVEDPTTADIASAMAGQDFAGSTPLIIGGSSGLGATVARMLAAAGAQPTITWRNSDAAAHAVKGQIESAGGAARLSRFDIDDVDGAIAALRAINWAGSEVYYFATPRIFRRNMKVYRPDDLRVFLAPYVDRFAEIAAALHEFRSGEPLSFFYPSTVAIDERTAGLLEYAMAKEAGERLCHAMATLYRASRFVVARLPRIDTRQTMNFIATRPSPPHLVMRQWVVEMQRKAVLVGASRLGPHGQEAEIGDEL